MIFLYTVISFIMKSISDKKRDLALVNGCTFREATLSKWFLHPENGSRKEFAPLKGKNFLLRSSLIRLQDYKTFFMLTSAEHEIFHADKSQITNNAKFFLAKYN